jgi:hypothetical protein
MIDRTGASLPPIHPDHVVREGMLAALDSRQLADRVRRVETCRERLRRNVDPGGLLEDLLVYLAVETPKS